MGKIIHRGARMAGAAGLAVIVAGCGLGDAGGPAGAPSTGPPVTVRQGAAPSVLLTVMSGPASAPGLSGLVAATARPSEDITILQAGTPPATVVAASSPAPPKIVVPGEPVAPGGGETSYQRALYTKRLKHWRDELAAARRADATLTREAVSAWLAQPRDPAQGRRAGRPAGRRRQPGRRERGRGQRPGGAGAAERQHFRRPTGGHSLL